jgi:(p)ppGpp synthase/HD superfamily hydrolase
VSPEAAGGPVARARALALEAHGDQRYGDEPYELHLAAVFGWVARLGGDADAQAAAWLHDAVEDTPLRLERVRAELGMAVAELVWAVSDGPGPNRATRKAGLYRRLGRASADARLVKLADRIANLEHAVGRGDLGYAALYASEHPAFRSALFRAREHAEAWRVLDDLVVQARSLLGG